MISNQILQNTIDGLKAITRTDLCVIDVESFFNPGIDLKEIHDRHYGDYSEDYSSGPDG